MDEDDDLFSNHDSDSGDFMNMDWVKAFIEGKKKVDKDLLSEIPYEKLFATLKQRGGTGANISQ